MKFWIHKLLQISKGSRWNRPFLYSLLVFFWFVCNPQFTWAQTIFVEAETALFVQPNISDESIAMTLSDDFHRALPGESLELQIVSQETGEKYPFHVVTDDSGAYVLYPGLPEGKYTGTVHFEGHDGYLEKSVSFEYISEIHTENAEEIEAAQTWSISSLSVPLGAGIGAILILSAAALLVMKKRRRMLPASPGKQQAEITRIPLPAKTSKSLIVCLDSKSGAPILPGELSIRIGGKKLEFSKWPAECEPGKVEILHPKYIRWTGKIHAAEKISIRLENRRDYIIRCFEATAGSLLNEEVEWGKLSPEEIREMRVNARYEALFKDFCERVSRAAFSGEDISEEDIDEIYGMSRKLL